MDSQTNIINPLPAKDSMWKTLPKFWPLLISLGVAIAFMFGTYFKFTAMGNDVIQLKKDVSDLQHEKVDKHEFKDLDDKVNRQFTTHTESINRVRAEFNPVRDWVEWRKGYDEALKDLKK